MVARVEPVYGGLQVDRGREFGKANEVEACGLAGVISYPIPYKGLFASYAVRERSVSASHV